MMRTTLYAMAALVMVVIVATTMSGCSTINTADMTKALLDRNWQFNITVAGRSAIGANWQSEKQATTTEGASNGSASAAPATPAAETDASSATTSPGTVLTEGDL